MAGAERRVGARLFAHFFVGRSWGRTSGDTKGGRGGGRNMRLTADVIVVSGGNRVGVVHDACDVPAIPPTTRWSGVAEKSNTEEHRLRAFVPRGSNISSSISNSSPLNKLHCCCGCSHPSPTVLSAFLPCGLLSSHVLQEARSEWCAVGTCSRDSPSDRSLQDLETRVVQKLVGFAPLSESPVSNIEMVFKDTSTMSKSFFLVSGYDPRTLGTGGE